MLSFKPLAVPAGVALLLSAAAVLAQIEGGSTGAAAVDSSGSFEVGGITVDVAGRTAEQARYGGWRLAQRKAWAQLSAKLAGGATTVSDATLDSMVSGIVVENEQIGPTRYIARLGVLFNRARAGSLLGISTYATRSPPMLVIPVQWSGGVGTTFETPSDWQAAWARYRAGNSAIDYVRPSGTGPDALLLNVGQVDRPGRGWWRTILAEYGASDVLMPTVRLYRQYPGGPIIGVFQARHGPDNRLLAGFSLRVGSAAGLPQLLDAGVRRMDDLYGAALRDGTLTLDSGLVKPPADPAPTTLDDGILPGDPLDQPGADTATTPAGQGIPVTIQFDTPNSGTVAAVESALRGIAGVRSAQTTSLALGGVSLARVVFDGDPDLLRGQLEARGFQVFGSGQTLRIRRAPQLLPPDLPPDAATAG